MLIATLSSQTINYVITCDTKIETNLLDFNKELRKHDHEEAGTTLVSNAVDVEDVFVLLIHC